MINQVLQDSSGTTWALGRQQIYYMPAGESEFKIIEIPDIKQYTSIAVFPGERIIVSADREGFFEVRDYRLTQFNPGIDTDEKITYRRIFSQSDSLFFININDRVYKFLSDQKIEYMGRILTKSGEGNLKNFRDRNRRLFSGYTPGAVIVRRRSGPVPVPLHYTKGYRPV